jgi:hypothetical protein
LHGHAIVKSIERESEDTLLVEQGSLYPALHRLIQRGWIAAEEGPSENNGARQILPADGEGAQAAGGRDQQLGAAGAGHRAHSEDRGMPSTTCIATSSSISKTRPATTSALAQKRAAGAGVRIQTVVQGSETFDWGENRWDLIVATYEPIREFRSQLIRALKPGGMVVIEAAHRDATKAMSIGAAVVFDSNELLQMFSDFRVLQYEDRLAQADFGARNTTSRIVRLCAQKP